MTQRIFDVENEKDMQDLWDILPDDCQKISYYRTNPEFRTPYALVDYSDLIAINWHDKTEITRPIAEATEALKAELKQVCDVLIRKCPEMKEWVMLNWKNLYEVQDD